MITTYTDRWHAVLPSKPVGSCNGLDGVRETYNQHTLQIDLCLAFGNFHIVWPHTDRCMKDLFLPLIHQHCCFALYWAAHVSHDLVSALPWLIKYLPYRYTSCIWTLLKKFSVLGEINRNTCGSGPERWSVLKSEWAASTTGCLTGNIVNINVIGKFSGTTWDAFYFAGKASRATNIQVHLQGYLTQGEIPQPSFQIRGQTCIDLDNAGVLLL